MCSFHQPTSKLHSGGASTCPQWINDKHLTRRTLTRYETRRYTVSCTQNQQLSVVAQKCRDNRTQHRNLGASMCNNCKTAPNTSERSCFLISSSVPDWMVPRSRDGTSVDVNLIQLLFMGLLLPVQTQGMHSQKHVLAHARIQIRCSIMTRAFYKPTYPIFLQRP